MYPTNCKEALIMQNKKLYILQINSQHTFYRFSTVAFGVVGLKPKSASGNSVPNW